MSDFQERRICWVKTASSGFGRPRWPSLAWAVSAAWPAKRWPGAALGNRQVIATVDTIGRKKTEVMKERIAQIAPGCQVECHDVFYLPGVTGILDESVDYAVDAIDTVTAKLFLAEECQRLSIPLISSMGTGNKLDPSRLTVTDIYQTSVCPLAKVMRRELRKRGIEALKVVYSTEEPKAVAVGEGGRRAVPGSVAFVPPAAGLLLASEVVKDLLEGKNHG